MEELQNIISDFNPESMSDEKNGWMGLTLIDPNNPNNANISNTIEEVGKGFQIVSKKHQSCLCW